MKKLHFFLFTTILLLTACGSSNSGETGNDKQKQAGKDKQSKDKQHAGKPEKYSESGGIMVPEGFEAKVVTDGVGKARHITVRENGDIYIALRNTKDGNGSIALRDENGDGKADIVKGFGEIAGTGIAIRNGYLYRTSTTAAYRYPLKKGELLPDVENRETIVKDFPEQGSHAAKPIDFDGNGNMYINVGAPSNACMKESRTKGSPGRDPCPLLKLHGGVWQYDADKTGQSHATEHRFATGMRNIVALDWNDELNDLYIVQHGRDQLHQFFPDLYTEKQNARLPSEEFHVVKKGDHLGWPYCYHDQIKGKKVLAPEYGGDGDSVGRCKQHKDPLIGFPGHWAPNDLLFYQAGRFPEKYENGAFIAFHGSWNRYPLPQAGYNVVFVPFDEGKPDPNQDWFVFAKGFKGKEELKSPQKAEYRPMGLATGPEGRLYVTDSQKGKVWVIEYTGAE